LLDKPHKSKVCQLLVVVSQFKHSLLDNEISLARISSTHVYDECGPPLSCSHHNYIPPPGYVKSFVNTDSVNWKLAVVLAENSEWAGLAALMEGNEAVVDVGLCAHVCQQALQERKSSRAALLCLYSDMLWLFQVR
jgi:hypothetical protein